MKLLRITASCIVISLLCNCGIVSRSLTSDTHHPYHLKVPVSTKNGVTMCYLEFDDQGEPWRDDTDRVGDFRGRQQLPQVLEAIRSVASSGVTRVVIFVHGWNNHGDSGNRRSFEETLGRLKQADPKTNVVGVYVSWRGMVSSIPTGIDVGNREAAASRIAGGPLLSSLREVSKAARYRKDGKETNNRVVMIGHSYGAKITATIFSNHLAMMDPEKPEPLADLFVLVNTAENGMLARHAVGMMSDYGIRYRSKNDNVDLPMVVVLGSDKDRAVRFLLPLWNHLTRDLASFAFPHKAGETSSHAQHKSIYRGMGYAESIRNRSFEKEQSISDREAERIMESAAKLQHPDNRVTESWKLAMRVNYKQGQDWAAGRSKDLKLTLYPNAIVRDFSKTETLVVTKQDSWNDTPFWIANVPGYVVKGHGDIWNQNFYAILAGIEGGSMPVRQAQSTEKAVEQKMPTPAGRPNLQFTNPL